MLCKSIGFYRCGFESHVCNYIYIYILTNSVFRGCVTEWFNVPGLSLGVLFRTRSSNLLASVSPFYIIYNLNTCIFIGDSILVNFIFNKWSRVRISSRPSIDILIFVLYAILYIGDSSLTTNLQVCWSLNLLAYIRIYSIYK